MRITPLPEVVVQLAHQASTAQDADGSFPPGHNGPYDDPETPVRNTSHWLITFSWLAMHGGDRRLRDTAFRAGEYLMGPRARPCGHSFDHRRKPGKDGCNGLIGQAWTIEALTEASKMLEEPAWAKLAADIFLRHPFRRDLGLWERVEVDGSHLGLDMTFNHQLWFAAAGALLAEVHEPSIGEVVRRFLDRVPDFMVVHPDGLIEHTIVHPYARRRGASPRRWREVLGAAIGEARRQGPWRARPSHGSSFTEQERRAGYQSFNLYAFALLKRSVAEHELWASEDLRRAVAAVLAYQYRNHLENNLFGYGYNAPGFEVPVALETFSGLRGRQLAEQCNWWVNEQFRRTMDWSTWTMRCGTHDPQTLTARIYEILRLPRELLEQISIPMEQDGS